ncbi:MAG: molecular chaperone TorD family protein [Methylobacterium sp.]|nr:molecular chaperone TorD family protein [Methylobacterium sp.]MCA3654512.1 molecular chaperone TorD family protein [Methylobacterium sp.]MCA3658659.1 molecular chaperone TorD family protein [Methylobacterium sp.]MCA3662021.1 molecular chaperone TorD family protein [Methylobacterium sp.]MCA3663743.1 molecular chaperone TorD family protein [Methylobacterium sp.]
MRDAGLQTALQAAGGASALARKLGVAQPSISGWCRVPAERVAAVEAATGVARHVLRPDLYPSEDGVSVPVVLDPIDEARAQLYLLFANLLLRVPDERILIGLRQLDGDDGALGEALRGLAAQADVTRAEEIAREHFDLFIGVGRGELLPFASYYQTGFLYERPLVRVRSDMRRLGLERGEEFQEPEDHLGFLMETMSGLIARRIPCEAREERAYFERHLKPWVERFFADLEKMDAQPFYRAVGRLGTVFMAIEREAFALDGAETPDAA